MPQNNSSIPHRYLVAGLFLLMLLVRGGSFGLSQNYSYDAVTRTTVALGWLKQPRLIPYVGHRPTQYAPLPLYLMGLSLSLWRNPLFSPRLVSLIFGCLTLLPLYYLVRLEFGPRSALYASLFMAFFSLHIKSSVVASSETIFCFFLLCGVYYIYRFKRQQHKKHLILAALFMNLAALSRYTGLLYIPLLSLLIVDKSRWKTSLKMGFLFLALSLILPGLWLMLHYKTYGQALYPLEFILRDHARTISQFRGAGRRLYYLLFWPAVVTLSLTPAVAGLSLLGIRESLRQRKHLGFLLLGLGPYIFFMYRSVIVGDFFLMPRFVVDSSIFLLPFAVIGMDKLQSHLSQQWQSRLPRLVIGSIILWLIIIIALSYSRTLPTLWVPLAEKMRAVSPISQLEPGQQRITAFLQQKQPSGHRPQSHGLKGHRPQGQIILDHNPTWAELEIMFYSSLPRQRFNTGIRQPQALINYITQHHPDHLILLPRGQLSQLLNHQALELLLSQSGVRARLLFNEAGYRLYSLSPIL